MLKIECSNPKIDWKDWNKEKPTSCLIAVNIICNLLESTFLSFWGWLPKTQFAILRSICTNGRATHDGCATPTGGRALPMRHPESSHPSCRRDIKVDYASQIVLHLAYFVQPLFEISRFTKDPKVGWTRFSRCFPFFSWSFAFRQRQVRPNKSWTRRQKWKCWWWRTIPTCRCAVWWFSEYSRIRLCRNGVYSGIQYTV